MSSVDVAQMSGAGTRQMSAAETGQMSAVGARQMYSIKTGQRLAVSSDENDFGPLLHLTCSK